MISNLEKILSVINSHLAKTKKNLNCNQIELISLAQISQNPLLHQLTENQLKQALQILPQIKITGDKLEIKQNLKVYDLDLLKNELTKKQIKLHYFSQMDSSNDYLLAKSAKANNPSLCLTEYQTKARGRYQKKWLCQPFTQITFSYLCKIKKFTPLEFLAIAIGIEIALALEKLGFAGIKLKWPNDLYYKDHNQYKKLAGILLDAKQKKDEHTIIIGLGLNLNQSDENNLQDFASLEIINAQLAQKISKDNLLLNLIAAIENAIKNLTQSNKSTDYYLKLWQKYDFLIDKNIILKTAKQKFRGINQGINQTGQILIKQSDKLTAFSSAEISLDKDSFS